MHKKIIAGIVILACGCGDDADITLPDPITVPGTYALNAVDGHTLPFAVLDVGAYRISIASGELKLNADSTYKMKMGLRVDDSGNIRFDADSDSGRWTRTNNEISMASTAGNLAKTGTVSKDGVILQSSTRVLSYHK